MRMKKVASEIVSDLAKAHLEVLRIHTEMHEYVLCFEEDYVVIAIYNQPNERDDGVKEEIEWVNFLCNGRWEFENKVNKETKKI